MPNRREIKKIFNKNGYAVLRNFISKKIIDAMVNDVMKLEKGGNIKRKWINLHYLRSGQLSSIHNIINHIPKYKNLATKTGLLRLFRENAKKGQKVQF